MHYHPLSNDNRGSVAVVDRAGKKRTLADKYIGVQALAWSPKGDEVWFTGTRTGARFDLRAVNAERAGTGAIEFFGQRVAWRTWPRMAES